MATAETEAASKAETISEADLKASTEVMVNLDCLGQLMTDCSAGSESACEELDKTEPLPCMV